jgi:hypothetical protein
MTELANTIDNSVTGDSIPATASFPLDVTKVEVDIDVSTSPKVQKILTARMTRPEKGDLVKREAMTVTEIVEATATEEKIDSDEERGNAWLFDRIVTEIKGVRLPGEPERAAEEFRPADENILGLLPDSWKSKFVTGMYSKVKAEIFEAEEIGVLIGGSAAIPVDLRFGDEDNPFQVIRFDVPEPQETERRKYQKDSVELRQPKGSTKSRNRIVMHLDASIKYFDLLMRRPEADIRSMDEATRVTVTDVTFEQAKRSANPYALDQFLAAIDPIYKRMVVNEAMSKYNAKVSD